MGTSVLMISKPVAPPWDDSSKNLVKDLALAGTRFTFRVLTPRGYRFPAPDVISEPIYSGGRGYSPPILQNLRVLLRLLQNDDTALTHFFFAPNPVTSAAARLALLLRRRASVQTVCSVPASFDRPDQLLFADKVVVLSDDTRRRFEERGVAPSRMTIIPPGIQIPAAPEPEDRSRARQIHRIPPEHRVVIFPGDYQFSSAAETFARAIPLLEDLPATFIFACRIKQAQSRIIEARIRALLVEAGVFDRVRMYNEVDDMIELLRACDICLLPAESTYAKMDLPLVLIEALALGVPLVVADRPPLTELVQDPRVGRAVPPGDPAALAAAVRSIVTDDDTLDHARQAARQFATERYAITSVVRRYEDLYAEQLEQ